MWFEWLVRRRDMGALAAVSPLQPLPGEDQQQGSETTIPQSDAGAMGSRWKAERREPAPHVFPPPGLLPTVLVSSPTWSPCKDLGYHAGPGGLKALSRSLLGDSGASCDADGQSWEQSQFSHETGLEPEQLSPRYRELKAGFWKRLAANGPSSHNDEPSDSSSARASEQSRSSNPAAGCKRAARGQPLERALNGSLEIAVVLTGKRSGHNTLAEAPAVPKLEQDAGNMQTGACNPYENGVGHHPEVQVAVIEKSPSATAAERDRIGDVCRITGAFSREASDGERETVPSHETPLQHHRHQQDGSECSFGSGRGIGRGRIGEDGSPTSTSSQRQGCEESRGSAGNLECNRKEEETFWSSANWCVVDSYMTGHGKETTWTVRGFEEDDGIFEENPRDCKHRRPLKLFANEKNSSRFSDLPVTQFLPVAEAPDVEVTRHGPPPKWTQQALHERVAKNLRASQQKELQRSTKNPGSENIVRSHKQTENGTTRSEAEDGCRAEAECRESAVPPDDLTSNADMPHCRRSSNACAGPSTFKGDHKKELPMSMVSRREIRRRKRGWAKGKACCVAMLDDTVKALRRTREDAAAVAVKLAELQAGEVKNLRAAASEMHTHVDLLRSEVQGLEAAGREFNVLVVFPWQQFFRNIVIGISLVSGTLGLHRAIKSFFRLLFARVGSVQTATSRKEKTMVAMVILCSGSYVGREMWQIFSQVQVKRKTHEAIFQEKLHLTIQRISHMSTLTYTGHQGQAED